MNPHGATIINHSAVSVSNFESTTAIVKEIQEKNEDSSNSVLCARRASKS